MKQRSKAHHNTSLKHPEISLIRPDAGKRRLEGLNGSKEGSHHTQCRQHEQSKYQHLRPTMPSGGAGAVGAVVPGQEQHDEDV